MKCKQHPKYKGTTKPIRDCQSCWKLYESNHPGGDTYKNWMHKCEIHKKYTGLRKPNNECKGCWDYYSWKNNRPNMLEQVKLKKKKKNQRKNKTKNKKTYGKLSNLLKNKFIKKDSYYHDWKLDYDKIIDPYEYIITTAVTNYIFYRNITKYKLFKFFDEINKLNKNVFGQKWLSVLKNKLDEEKFENIQNEYISEPKSFSSYALDDYKKFIELKYFKNENFDFENYNLEIL